MAYIIERILIVVVAVAVGAGVAVSLVSIYGGGDGEDDQAIGVPTPDATLEAWIKSTEATLPAETPIVIPETTTPPGETHATAIPEITMTPGEAPTKTPRPLIPLPEPPPVPQATDTPTPTPEPAPGPTPEPAPGPTPEPAPGPIILLNSEGRQLLAELLAEYEGDLDFDVLAKFIRLAADLSDSP